MKRILHLLAIAFISLALIVPPVDAQNRTTGNRGHNSSQQTHRPENRPANRPQSKPQNRPQRPGNNGNHNRPENRPQNRPDNRPPRPGNNGNHNRPQDRPHNRPVQNRPNNNWHFGRPQQPRPPRPPRPGIGHVPPGHVRPPMMRPPMRPHRPRPSHWSRPVPPPSWRPRPHAPSFAAILGITFGTALNLSLDYLINHGYTVDGYGNNVVYLRDINQFNYYWPDATLYYGNGGLSRSEFLYSTSYPDMMRYNALYNSFTGTYGVPVNYTNSGASLSATWFAPNRGYITLQYNPQYSLGGQVRYFTTLTFGL